MPTKRLNFEAIIGTDILGQASLNFTQEGVMFHKHEEKTCLMQISGLHPEDELDFSHILDSQVKNDLTRITSSYKPEKTESTDVTRRIILNDDIPAYQPARRLSYAEKKRENKHIEEWLEQGIVRPSSSEYASPIVLVKNKKTYKKRKKAPEYQVGELVAVQRTQFGGGLKLRPAFFRPYQITEVKPRDRYTVEKVTASPIDGTTSEYMYPHGVTGFRRENDCDAERDRHERRDSGFTGEMPRFPVNVEANRLSDN
ncbi:tigger transposable element-derived protein 6 [Trichonephila clavipes]|nr:tigger transposable element-derived protein 6 [Trichonephila clavipes]